MHPVQSPRTDEAAIEQRIQALGATAPRVTPDDMAANIVHIEFVKHVSHSGQVLRWAVLTTKNGYACVGNPSVSVSAENDRQEIGESVAFENSKNALWPLMGYALKQQLHDIKHAQPPATDEYVAVGSSLFSDPSQVKASPADEGNTPD